MRWNFEQITSEAAGEVAACSDLKALENLRVKYLGRKGLLTDIYASLPTLSAEEKPLVGKEANNLRILALLFMHEIALDEEGRV